MIISGGSGGIAHCNVSAVFPVGFCTENGKLGTGAVTLIGTPAVFFGYAQILLCVWSIEKCGAVLQLTDRTARMREGTVKKNGEK